MIEKYLEKYLEDNKRVYYKDSINYKGIRKTKMDDGSFKNFHIVFYMVSISNQKYDSDATYCARFDENKHNLIDIIGPQSWEIIQE